MGLSWGVPGATALQVKLRMTSRMWLSALVLLILSACPDRSKPVADAAVVEPADAGAPDADAGPATLDGGADAGEAPDAAIALTELPITIEVEVDGGLEAVEFKANAAEIEPGSVFMITSPVALKDFRVRLIDWADQVVPSDDTAILDGGLSYRLVLTQPTRPGRSYTLTIDAELGPLLLDRSGHDWEDVRRTLTIRGELQPENGKAVKKKPTPHKPR